MIRSPPRQARSIHFQYVLSWVRESWRGQPAKDGQPSVLWVPIGFPVLRKFSKMAVSPFRPWSAQSSSATVTP